MCQIDLAIAVQHLANRQTDLAAQRSAQRQGLGPAGIDPAKPRIGDQVPNKRPGPAQNPIIVYQTRDLYLGH